MSDASYDPWTLQLVSLASQHHLSEYNRLKHGHRGSPVPYAPLSIHLPDVARSLRERQGKYADQLLWWPCASHREPSPVIPAAMQRAALATGEAIPHPDLQQQLSTAISESIQRHQTIHSARVKTSETHPINVSQIIPPESLIAISSLLIPSKQACPVLFEMHFPYSPDLITGFPARVPPNCSVPVPPPQHKYLPSGSSVTGALNTALNTRIPFSSLPVPSPRILLSLKRTFKSHSVSDASSGREAPVAISKSISCLPVSPPQSCLPPIITLPTSYALHPFSSHIRLPSPSSPSNKTSKFRVSRSRSSSASSPGQSNPRPLRLGNLLLSSCPGKKVRLSGPVRGRSAICRDLDADLRRMKMLGARCVVCCLDDEELEFLIGTSWSEYCHIAHREGLDVLRIPLPEGLAPLSPQALDADIDCIIQRYTLQGISVLVHCRGGVGRAGLFACCWMLKLGLCGWIETDTSPSTTTTTGVSETKRDHDPSESVRWDSETVVRRDTLQMVERVIEVIRRRRSVKAIETLEQVQFLVEYVDYLRACGRAGTARNSPPSS